MLTSPEGLTPAVAHDLLAPGQNVLVCLRDGALQVLQYSQFSEATFFLPEELKENEWLRRDFPVQCKVPTC